MRTPRYGKTVNQRLKSDDYNIWDCVTRDKSERSVVHKAKLKTSLLPITYDYLYTEKKNLYKIKHKQTF